MRTESVRMLEFAQHGDERGHLVVVEGMKDIPFEIKRVFYIYGSDADVVRGCHANRRSEFVLINVAGQSKVRVRDGVGNEAVFSINRPHTGLYLPRMVLEGYVRFFARFGAAGALQRAVRRGGIHPRLRRVRAGGKRPCLR